MTADTGLLLCRACPVEVWDGVPPPPSICVTILLSSIAL